MKDTENTADGVSDREWKLLNARISDIGLYYLGHGNVLSIKCDLEGRGWGATVTIPMEKVRKFIRMFQDDIDLEDGIYVHELVNAKVRVAQDKDRKIVALGDILAEEDEMVEL